MTTYVVLLRAVNVGGTGKLPMEDLRAMCADAGFHGARTYIASGNVVLASGAAAPEIKAALEQRLHAYAGRPVGVLVRTADEIAAIVAANPFPDAPPNRVVTIFLNAPASDDFLDAVKHQADEEIVRGACEIYVQYKSGMGHSKLVIPAARSGTARNMNTVAKLAEMARSN